MKTPLPQATFILDSDALGPAFFEMICAGRSAFTMIDVQNCRSKMEEIEPFLESFESSTLNSLFKGTSDLFRQLAFDEISLGDGFVIGTPANRAEVTRDEWESFMVSMQKKRYAFYEKMFLLKGLKYAGHGLEPGDEYNKFVVKTLKVCA